MGSFGGFEATVVFSEEAKDRRRTVPRATYLAIAFIGLFYGLSTWALSNGVGNSKIREIATQDPTGFIFAAAHQYVGAFWSDLMSVLVVTSFFAILLGFTNIYARYIFALGRAGVIPRWTAHIHPRHGSPSRGVFVASISIVLIIGGFMIAKADPFTTLYTWLLALGTVALLAMLCLTSLSVIGFFRKHAHGRAHEGMWRTAVAPAFAAVGFAIAIYLSVANYDVLVGGQGGVARWLPILIPILAALGYLIGVWRRDQIDFSDLEADPDAVVPTSSPQDGRPDGQAVTI